MRKLHGFETKMDEQAHVSYLRTHKSVAHNLGDQIIS